MASWAEIGRRDPDSVIVVGVLGALVQAVRGRPQQRPRFDWDMMAIERFQDDQPPDILGVGLLASPMGSRDSNGLQPTLFVTGDAEWTELGDIPLSISINQRGGENEARVRVVGLPGAQPLANTGDRCDTPTSWGTLGARVTAKSGVDGVLIAGHVANATSASVSDQSGGVLGTVAECVHPGQVSPQTPSGDVAVIELSAGAVVGGVAHATTAATVLPRDDVEIHGASTGVTRTWIRGIATFWAGPDPGSGDWGSVLVTRDGTTGPGDSGALVLRDGTLDPVGHVVGGVPGVYTLIQELDDQLLWVGAISLR